MTRSIEYQTEAKVTHVLQVNFCWIAYGKLSL